MQLVSGMKRGRGMESQPAFVLTRNGVARLLDLFGGKRRTLGLGDSDHKPSFTDERDGDRRRLDLDPAITPAYIEGRSRPQAGLIADVFGDDQPTRRIHGCFHTIDSTTPLTMRTIRRLSYQGL